MPERLKKELISSIPKIFMEKLFIATPRIYHQAYSTTFKDPNLIDSSKEYSYPHYRRGLFDSKLLQLAEESGCAVTIEENLAKNFRYPLVHTKSVLLAQSHVNKDMSQLRPSLFRKQHSEANWYAQQLDLGLVRKSVLRKPNAIFALILHSTSEDNPETYGFLKIAIPNMENDDWVGYFDVADLLSAYPMDESAELAIEQNLPILKPSKKQHKLRDVGDGA